MLTPAASSKRDFLDLPSHPVRRTGELRKRWSNTLCRTFENTVAILGSVTEDPNLSTRCRAAASDIDRGSLMKILKKDLKQWPYRYTLHQGLKPQDLPARVNLANWILLLEDFYESQESIFSVTSGGLTKRSFAFSEPLTPITQCIGELHDLTLRRNHRWTAPTLMLGRNLPVRVHRPVLLQGSARSYCERG